MEKFTNEKLLSMLNIIVELLKEVKTESDTSRLLDSLCEAKDELQSVLEYRGYFEINGDLYKKQDLEQLKPVASLIF